MRSQAHGRNVRAQLAPDESGAAPVRMPEHKQAPVKPSAVEQAEAERKQAERARVAAASARREAEREKREAERAIREAARAKQQAEEATREAEEAKRRAEQAAVATTEVVEERELHTEPPATEAAEADSE